MILGVDLTGEELERYEEVRAARIKMELDGTPSPFCADRNPGAPKPSRRHSPASRDGVPFLALRLRDWIGRSEKFSVQDAAIALGVSRNRIWACYKILRQKCLTDATITTSDN